MILCEQDLAEFDLDFGLDLVEKIGIKDQLMDSIEELGAKYSITKNTAEFNRCIDTEQEKSLQYLQKNI